MRILPHQLFSFFFPKSCAGCSRPGTALCERCSGRLPLASSFPTPDHYAVYDYADPLVCSVIQELKYHRRSDTARVLTFDAVPFIHEYLSERLHALHPQALLFIPLPQHPEKTRMRGFNQSALIARLVASEISGARVVHLLRKKKSTAPQAHLHTRRARLANVVDTMEATQRIAPHHYYILIDDVITTGATITEAARALREAGAVHISAIALAHGYAQKKRP